MSSDEASWKRRELQHEQFAYRCYAPEDLTTVNHRNALAEGSQRLRSNCGATAPTHNQSGENLMNEDEMEMLATRFVRFMLCKAPEVVRADDIREAVMPSHKGKRGVFNATLERAREKLRAFGLRLEELGKSTSCHSGSSRRFVLMQMKMTTRKHDNSTLSLAGHEMRGFLCILLPSFKIYNNRFTLEHLITLLADYGRRDLLVDGRLTDVKFNSLSAALLRDVRIKRLRPFRLDTNYSSICDLLIAAIDLEYLSPNSSVIRKPPSTSPEAPPPEAVVICPGPRLVAELSFEVYRDQLSEALSQLRWGDEAGEGGNGGVS